MWCQALDLPAADVDYGRLEDRASLGIFGAKARLMAAFEDRIQKLAQSDRETSRLPGPPQRLTGMSLAAGGSPPRAAVPTPLAVVQPALSPPVESVQLGRKA